MYMGMDDLYEWAERFGRGALKHLECETRLANKTVIKAVTHGLPVTYEVAEKLSKTTGVPVDRIRAGWQVTRATRRRRSA